MEITKVAGKAGLKAFIDFPHDLYAEDPNYVPELFIAQRDLLTKHPFHKHNQLQLFLARENGKVTGRIAAILNNSHNEFNSANDGFFGFFDCINDEATSNALLETAENWLREKKVATMIGPVNFSTNESCGMLLTGYDSPPVAMMTYNKPYYHELMADANLHKKVDLIAWKIERANFNDKSARLMDALRTRLERKGIVIRKADFKNFKAESARIKEVYNSAWDKNLGFVPMTEAEFDYMAKDLKMIADPDFVLVAEHEGKIIGFALCIPDINQIFIKIKKGRLLPTGIFKLLFQKKKINAMRVIALGVLEPYRKMGIEGVFYGTIIQKGLEKGMQMAEASWILEDNTLMNLAIEHINGTPYKTYRIYEKALA